MIDQKTGVDILCEDLPHKYRLACVGCRRVVASAHFRVVGGVGSGGESGRGGGRKNAFEDF